MEDCCGACFIAAVDENSVSLQWRRTRAEKREISTGSFEDGWELRVKMIWSEPPLRQAADWQV